ALINNPLITRLASARTKDVCPWLVSQPTARPCAVPRSFSPSDAPAHEISSGDANDVKFITMSEPSPAAADVRAIRETFSHYARLIGTLLEAAASDAPFVPEVEDADRVQVERGILFPRLLLNPAAARTATVEPVERLIALASPETLQR